jgi:hypothetical protein
MSDERTVRIVAAPAKPTAEEIAEMPWRCVPCWRERNLDVQLEDKKQGDPTSRQSCPECGASWWAKTGLDQ